MHYYQEYIYIYMEYSASTKLITMLSGQQPHGRSALAALASNTEFKINMAMVQIDIFSI